MFDNMIVMPWDHFNYDIIKTLKLVPRPRGNRKGNNRHYVDAVAAFDIETSKLKDDSTITYLWQFCINGITLYGRYWSEYFEMLREIKKNLTGWLVIFDFNLSYEFHFLKGYYAFEPDEVFAVKSRKVLKCDMFDCYEYRCAYMHSNMKLEKFLANMGVPVQKSEIDYTVERWPWDPLPLDVLEYGARDVAGLVQAIEKELELEDKTLYTLPLTSTGFVRDDAKRAMKGFNHFQLMDMQPDADIYALEVRGFRGGDVHANRYYVGDIVTGAAGADRSSSYPAVMCCDNYPMSKFIKCKQPSYEKMIDLTKRGKALLFEIIFYGLREKDLYNGCPYFSSHKCDILTGAVLDNGRVMRAAECLTVLTDVDYKIVRDIYDWDSCEVTQLYFARYGKLPEQLRAVVIDYYKRKTALKNKPGEEYYYFRSKEKLNALYGMCAQRPVTTITVFENNSFREDPPDVAAQLEKNKRRAFLNYAWALWVTAWARLRLHEGRKLAGPKAIYWDTDSVKYTGVVDFEKYNQQRIKESKAAGAWADDATGKRHYMGVFEHEGDYSEFKTLGCKRYVYIEDGKLKITIAGVAKDSGAAELDNINNFKDGFIFHDGAGMESKYIDDICRVIIKDGHRIQQRDYISLLPTTYELGLSGDYERLLNGLYDLKYMPFNIKNHYTNFMAGYGGKDTK